MLVVKLSLVADHVGLNFAMPIERKNKMNKLSKKQKSVLAQIANKAFKRVMAMYKIGETYDDWRRAEQFRRVGKWSLTDCHQSDYVPLYNHFAKLAGIKAIEDHTRSEEDKAAWSLNDAVRRFEINEPYLRKIAQDKFAMIFIPTHSIDELIKDIVHKLTYDQSRQLLYTINNRGRSAVRRTAREFGVDTPVEYHTSGSMPPVGLAKHFNCAPLPSPKRRIPEHAD